MEIRMLIVDNGDMVGDELRTLLELTGEIQVVGETSDSATAQKLIETQKPSIVLIDLETTGLNGSEVTREIKNRWPTQKVAVLTFDASTYNRQQAKHAGADAFIVKGTDLRTKLKVFEDLASWQGDVSQDGKDTIRGE